ncbi:MAG: hypothetical protein WCR95_06065 [Eubacteriales bacterium]
MFSRRVSLLLSVLFVLTLISASLFLSSCGEPSPGDSSSAISDPGEPESNESSVSEEIPYEPEQLNLGGVIFNFLVPGSGYSYYESFEIYSEERTEETINDAVYNRNQLVESRLGCLIRADKSNNVTNDLRLNFDAGLNTYDVYMPMINDAAKIAGDGYMLDLHDFEQLNLAESWWDQKANEGLEINGKLFFSTGDISILDNDCTMVMFFNKKLARDYGIGDVYKMVEEKTWTLDHVYEISKGFSENKADENIWDNHDNYGLHVAFNAPHSFYFGCGGTITETDAEGNLVISITSKANQSILSRVFEIAFKPDVLTNKNRGCGTFQDICPMFLNDQVMFTTFALIDIKGFRGAEGFDFGILPYPLLDSEQESYRCLVSTGLVPCVVIPANCKSPENTASVLDAMAFYSVETLTKAYYDKTLKGRDLVDEESERMLDIIFSSRVYDLGYIYNFGGIGELIQNMNIASSSDFVSYYDRIEGKVMTDLFDAMEKFR